MSCLSKKSFTMRQVIGLLTIVFLGITARTHAASFSDFTSGTPISSSEMNTKLNTLKEEINRKYTTNCAGESANDIMVRVGNLCVDKYEASVWSNMNGTGALYGASADDYPSTFPDNGNWTSQVYAVSKAGVPPSRFITWFQAQQACAASHKRLLTNAEWQMAAAGTPDSTACNVSSGDLTNTGEHANCVSNYQVNDMVGNLTEWVADWMQGTEGNGVPGAWTPNAVYTSSATYGSDGIFGINEANNTDKMPAAILRGGFYSSGGFAGVFAMDASIAPSGFSSSIGFRCAR